MSFISLKMGSFDFFPYILSLPAKSGDFGGKFKVFTSINHSFLFCYCVLSAILYFKKHLTIHTRKSSFNAINQCFKRFTSMGYYNYLTQHQRVSNQMKHKLSKKHCEFLTIIASLSLH